MTTFRVDQPLITKGMRADEARVANGRAIGAGAQAVECPPGHIRPGAARPNVKELLGFVTFLPERWSALKISVNYERHRTILVVIGCAYLTLPVAVQPDA